MPEDYYSDAPVGAPEAEPAARDQTADEQTTAVIPKSICPGMKVGDEVVLRIVAEHADEFEVSYAPEEGGDEEEAAEPGEEAPPAPALAPDEMASMME